MRSKAKFLIPILIALVIPVALIGLNFYSSSQSKKFVRKCTELNGKAFTYENLLTLNGYIGLAEDKYEGDRYTSGSFGYYPFEKQYFDKYLDGEFIVNDSKHTFKNVKLIMVFSRDNSFSIAEGRSVEGLWSCRIQRNSNNSLMKTTPYLLPVH